MKMWVSKKEFIPNWMVRHPYKANIVRGEEYEKSSYLIICPICLWEFRLIQPLNGGHIDFLKKHLEVCSLDLRNYETLARKCFGRANG